MIMNRYSFTKVMNWLCTTKVIGSKRKNVLNFLLRISLGFGSMKTHKITIKLIHNHIGLYHRAISKALYQLRDIGFIDFNQGKKLKKGGKFVVHIKEKLFNYEVDSYLKNKGQESEDKVQEVEDKVQEVEVKVQKRHYPPLAKESIKETSKEIIKDYWFKDLKKVWFNSAKTEALKKQIFQRFNPDSESVFNQLPLNTRKKIIQSLEFAFVDWNKEDTDVQYIAGTTKYIQTKWKEYYEPVRQRENRRRLELKRVQENLEAEANAPKTQEDLDDIQKIIEETKKQLIANRKG